MFDPPFGATHSSVQETPTHDKSAGAPQQSDHVLVQPQVALQHLLLTCTALDFRFRCSQIRISNISGIIKLLNLTSTSFLITAMKSYSEISFLCLE